MVGRRSEVGAARADGESSAARAGSCASAVRRFVVIASTARSGVGVGGVAAASRGSGGAVGVGVDVGTGVGVGVSGMGVAVAVGDGVGVSGTGAAVAVGGGVGVLGMGVAVKVGARETAGTVVEVGGWLTVSETPQATAKMSVAPISVRRTREKVAASSCPLPAWMMGGA